MKIYNISEETGLKLKTANYTGLNPGFEYFNPPQSKFVKENLHKKDCNLIIAWSTSAGKTVAAELKIENQLARGNKIVYACPLKALAEEKIKRFKKLFPYRNIEIFTGDYNDFDKRKYKAKNADIAIVTTELLDSITRNKTLTYYLLNSTGTVIIDEFHIIATERGPAVESAIIRLPEHISVMLLSATVPNTEEVAEWIYSLNKKETYIFESSYRPVKIDWELIHINYKLYGYWIKHALAKLIELIFDILKFKDKGQILIFVWTKQTGYEIEKLLKSYNIPCHFHNASLTLNDRNDFENDFETGKIKVLIATTTLAWGKNTSARYVIIFGDKRGNDYVDGWDIIQMGGRAGRLGYTVKGDVFWFISNREFAYEVLDNPPKITSMLINPEKLAFHIIGEIPFKESISINNIWNWYNKTFAAKQITKEKAYNILNEAFEILIEKTKSVSYNSEKKEIKLTKLGIVAKRFYLDPQEVWSWYRMFKIFENNLISIEKQIKKPFFAFILFLAHSRVKNLYLTKNEKEELMDYMFTYREHGPFFYDDIHFYLTVKAYEWYEKNVNSLINSGRKIYPHYKVRDFLYDLDRIAGACSSIAYEVLKNKILAENINKISLVLKYGVPVETYELLQIRGIGAVRASKLFKLNIYDLNSLKKAISEKNQDVIKILPANVINEIKELNNDNKKNLSGIKTYG